jgi:hypothetical protein
MYSNPIREEEKERKCNKCKRVCRVDKDGVYILVCGRQSKRMGQLVVLQTEQLAGNCLNYERRPKNQRMPYLKQNELFARAERPLNEFLSMTPKGRVMCVDD